MRDVEVTVAWDPAYDDMVVFARSNEGGRRYVLEVDEGGHLVPREFSSSMTPPPRPLFRHPGHAFLDAMARALIDKGYGPKDEQAGAVRDHLADARTVRDRLLTIVERA